MVTAAASEVLDSSRSAPLERANGGVRYAPLAAGLVAGVPAFGLYVLTLMPDVGLWDTAEFQAVGPVLGIAHPTGYPTYTLLAWLASVVLQPFGEPALRANLLSAILVGLAVAATAATVVLLTRRFVLGVAAGAGLAVSTLAWSVGLRADPHALHLALAALLLLLLVAWAERTRRAERTRLPAAADRWLLAAAVLLGLALGNHALALLLAPGIGLFVIIAAPAILRRPRFVLTCLAALAVTTLAVYAYLPLRSAMNPPLDYADPQTWEGFRYLVFGEQFRGDFAGFPPILKAVQTVVDVTLRELGVLAVLAVVGLVAAARRRLALVLLLSSWFVVTWAFALGYQNADIGRYYLVPMLSVVVLAGLGAAAIWHGLEVAWRVLAERRHWRVAPAPAAAAPRIVVSIVVGALLLAPVLANLPSRYDQLDRSGPTDGRLWLDAVLPQLDQRAVVISWWTYSTALWYAQYVDGLRPDVEVIDDSTVVQRGLGSAYDAIELYLPERPVYLVRLTTDLPEFTRRYVLAPLPGAQPAGSGQVYRVEGIRRGSGRVVNL